MCFDIEILLRIINHHIRQFNQSRWNSDPQYLKCLSECVYSAIFSRELICLEYRYDGIPHVKIEFSRIKMKNIRFYSPVRINTFDVIAKIFFGIFRLGVCSLTNGKISHDVKQKNTIDSISSNLDLFDNDHDMEKKLDKYLVFLPLLCIEYSFIHWYTLMCIFSNPANEWLPNRNRWKQCIVWKAIDYCS